MKGRKKKGTGKVGYGSHMKSAGGKDGNAHPTHMAANRDNGMPEGFAPSQGYDGADAAGDSHMGCNEEYGGEG